MQMTITEFQRNFRSAREAADRGDAVVVTGDNGRYVFERRTATDDHPFEGLEGVFGAVTLPQAKMPLRTKVRRRLAAKSSHRRRGPA